MRTFTKTASLLFLSVASVYSNQAIAEAAGISAPSRVEHVYAAPQSAPAGSDATLLEPTTAPADVTDPFATTEPVNEGKSVSDTDVNVSDTGTVEIHVNDANLVEVLRMLSLQSQKNIIASKDVRGTITANLYDVTVSEALDAILHANGYAYREKGNFIYVYTLKEIEDQEKAEMRMSTRVFRLSYTPAANAQTMIKPVLSEGAEVAITTPALSGIETGTAGLGGNDHATEDLLIVTDFPDKLDRIAEILAEVDRRPQQILLEATILRATLNENNALGVDFNLLAGVNFNSIVSNAGGQLTGAGVNTGNPADEVAGVGTGNNFAGTIPGGVKVGVITDNVSIFLSALEGITDTTVLANPKVLALNKHKGEVRVGNEFGYRTTVITENAATEQIESLETGTTLVFRPYITEDGYIRMEVLPEDSSGFVDSRGLPQKSVTKVTSNVMVKDGHTIVIGGLFRESTVMNRNQIPILGNIPFAGALFRQQSDITSREEVIILLTPHIIKDDSVYSQMSEKELKLAEQLRIGARRGLMPWGRERLAEGSYEAARKELRKENPNRGKALWHLNCATNLNPRMVEAIQLKEQISGQVVTGSDGSSIRSFVRRAMIEDFQVPVPPATMPATQPTEVASAPATQPASVAVISAPAPATQPVADSSKDESDSSESSTATEIEVAIEEKSDVEFSTEPSAQNVEAVEMTVTELPMEEVDGGSFDVDGVPVEVGTK